MRASRARQDWLGVGLGLTIGIVLVPLTVVGVWALQFRSTLLAEEPEWLIPVAMTALAIPPVSAVCWVRTHGIKNPRVWIALAILTGLAQFFTSVAIQSNIDNNQQRVDQFDQAGLVASFVLPIIGVTAVGIASWLVSMQPDLADTDVDINLTTRIGMVGSHARGTSVWLRLHAIEWRSTARKLGHGPISSPPPTITQLPFSDIIAVWPISVPTSAASVWHSSPDGATRFVAGSGPAVVLRTRSMRDVVIPVRDAACAAEQIQLRMRRSAFR
ncbi:hypothetical protein [Nocardia rhizosphaerae]|uniref:Uncharacterized protein n=1 Tax=Nocardia rhizosphaerae TaxID=1691571 RepID=A0ABV8LBZ8_9NOCA